MDFRKKIQKNQNFFSKNIQISLFFLKTTTTEIIEARGKIDLPVDPKDPTKNQTHRCRSSTARRIGIALLDARIGLPFCVLKDDGLAGWRSERKGRTDPLAARWKARGMYPWMMQRFDSRKKISKRGEIKQDFVMFQNARTLKYIAIPRRQVQALERRERLSEPVPTDAEGPRDAQKNFTKGDNKDERNSKTEDYLCKWTRQG